ncbi:hypothetical protein, partial [Pseudoalteromonas sp. XMcav2-N-2]|uniref:hypothetical protein n=1 Tax=Pseudoalteromonas sp. XMcav2-N-2 TaxID=3136666 RepID=UPI0032C41F03
RISIIAPALFYFPTSMWVLALISMSCEALLRSQFTPHLMRDLPTDHTVRMTNTPKQTYSALKNRFKWIPHRVRELLEVWQSRINLEPLLERYS